LCCHTQVDRLEYLTFLEVYLQEPENRRWVDEVVFEPKRMYLGDMTAAAFVEALQGLRERTGVRVRLALPTVVRAWDEAPLRGLVKAFQKAAGEQAAFEVGNLGALALLEKWGVPPAADLSSDFTLYALNSVGSRFWAEQGIGTIALSVEDDEENMKKHLRSWAVDPEVARPQAIVYKDTPLFIAEACSLTALHGGCPGSKVCGYRTLEIANADGEEFLVAHEHCKSVVYAREAFSLAHRQRALLAMGVRDFKVDFLTRQYSPEEMQAVLQAVLHRRSDDVRRLDNTHSANFERQLL
jgi:U32 family peptidase